MKSSKTFPAKLAKDLFWQSVNILITKPHVINKRIWGSKVWYKYHCKSRGPIPELPKSCGVLEELITKENVEEHMSNLLEELDDCSFERTFKTDAIEVILVELLPKTYTDKQAYQLVFLQKEVFLVTFFNVTPASYQQNLCPDYSYSIQCKENEVVLTAYTDEKSKSYLWLSNTLLPQFVKYATNAIDANNYLCSESLALVAISKYYERYNDLKLKYGKEMVKIWPECTDASKFVYEDVAIATYLLLLWEEDKSKPKKTFVDLGCGNGLLVYILTQEGHSGIGIDVRKRNIWDMYPSNIKLHVKTITPSDTSIFPDVDWIIGNHSDELTPWISVIAARSSYSCNYFLLPCCAYNFDGSKFQRKCSNISQYTDYLSYIYEIGRDCGFNVSMDRLKIPSTKRICLVSRGRVYPKEEHETYLKKINDIINCGSNETRNAETDLNFKARESVEIVRNCTQIDKSVVTSIVNSITKYLLEGCSDAGKWSTGKTVDINEVVQLIPKEQLKILKSECGGLQTLLKNNHNIFKVQTGKVELRYPKTIEEVNNNIKKRKPNQPSIKIQQKPCWFYSNHPQGCPLLDTQCSFLHIKS